MKHTMSKASPKPDAGELTWNGHSLGPSVVNWQRPNPEEFDKLLQNVALDLGWGRLIFGHTYASARELAEELCGERRGQRDIALYLRDPHVVLSLAPDRLFLDPSHTFRLWKTNYTQTATKPAGVVIRRIQTAHEIAEANRIYAMQGMVPVDERFVLEHQVAPLRNYFVALTAEHEVIGTVIGVDHVTAFSDCENGSSLWCLAVDPQAQVPGVGEALVRHVLDYFFGLGRNYVDLSVMHDNIGAIRLYEKLGFERIPAFCVKHKNPINEKYFVREPAGECLNPYAKIIVDEARRRGIYVKVLDGEAGYFSLQLGGRQVVCRESLTELTSAIAMSRCDDKRVTRRLMEAEGIRVPVQKSAADEETNNAFLARFGRVVVKPARGEQGMGIAVDITTPDQLAAAVKNARNHCPDVVIEEMVEGDDLRVIVINGEVVAAAVRKPPVITGTGNKTVRDLIARYNRRREAATGGESRVPMDDETLRCIRQARYDLDDVLPEGTSLRVRKTANVHTGGTIHDVTDQLHPDMIDVSIRVAAAIGIPVTGLDFMVPDVSGNQYWLIEANERPGLANHEPQPTAQRFIDFLFPETVAREP